jgi:hypothetical protein
MRGLETAAKVRKTVYDFIADIVKRGKSHREVAAECDQFSLMTLVPLPYKKAIDAIALHHGWSREGLWQGVIANFGWLEHNRSRAVDRPGDEHKRVLPEPCLCLLALHPFASPP